MVMFNLICVAGAAINVTILYVLHGRFGFSDVLSQLVGIGAATLWNYVLNITWTWSRQIPKRDMTPTDARVTNMPAITTPAAIPKAACALFIPRT
jgi:hypothetical protein